MRVGALKGIVAPAILRRFAALYKWYCARTADVQQPIGRLFAIRPDKMAVAAVVPH